MGLGLFGEDGTPYSSGDSFRERASTEDMVEGFGDTAIEAYVA